ncbi:MAG: SDR family oxidoreductase [Ruminococcus sp.]|nr:SDR family oxidoreductase [Ruminococcus sp.]
MKQRKCALITGASSGIGYEIAKQLNQKGFDLIITARRADRLNELKNQLKGNVTVIPCDLSDEKQCMELYRKTCSMNVSVLINNAGFGAVGYFNEIPLKNETDMIKTNCIALHSLTKMFLKDFIEKDRGYILNVASSAGLMPGGPLMATYYATKAFVTSLTSGISEELKSMKSHVSISALCPGPVNTEFNKVANAKFNLKSITAEKCAELAIKGMFERKLIIIPSLDMKASSFAGKALPRRLMLSITKHIQTKKIK